MHSSAGKTKIALVGDVALDLLAPFFREADFDVYVPSGFATWRQEILDKQSTLHQFAPALIFDVTAYDSVLSSEVDNFFDERMRTLAHMPYSLDGIHALIDEARFAACAREHKILAIDADNTLWRGIVSEDGRDALVPYREFQDGLLTLRAQGALLVLLTKNDPCDRFFRDDMPLRDEHFANRQINWAPKAGNLLSACRALNLATDSVVFLDDNPFERAQMHAHLPEVTVAPWTGWRENANAKNEHQLVRRLRQYFFATLGATREDALRAHDYASPARALAQNYASAADYLRALDLRVESSLASVDDLPRLAQMAGKTNQFNATTIRRTRDDFANLLARDDMRIFTFKTRDKFGEQGLVCYVVVNLATRRVTDFVMSCRAMGRTLEHFAWKKIREKLNFTPSVDFVASAKNNPFKLFREAGFHGETYYREI